MQNGDEVTVVGKGLEGLQEPKAVLDVGNSESNHTFSDHEFWQIHHFFSCVQGDASIAKRPMKRVTNPLKQMGA
ncbi:hypothetical protein ACT7DA_06015 [Bacillus pacificus]